MDNNYNNKYINNNDISKKYNRNINFILLYHYQNQLYLHKTCMKSPLDSPSMPSFYQNIFKNAMLLLYIIKLNTLNIKASLIGN